MKYSFVIIALALFVFGCSSQHESATTFHPKSPTITSTVAAAEGVKEQPLADDADTSSFVTDSTYDTVVSDALEAARGHYQGALDAREVGDSLKCVSEFEAAIGELNEVATFPGIDTSADFTDLSRSVVEDYEKYIAVIDSLGPQTSIFALREKLVQMSDTTGGVEKDAPKKIITTTTIPLVINGHVEEDIEFLRTRFHDHFETWLNRSGVYFPTVQKIFRKEGVPEELAYLSFIESGVNPNAQSWAKAVGMWQFVKGTGQLYGLRANFWYDERRDFIKASRAAARHFRDLHNEFGDWYLALAAYNSGPGRVYRAMRKSGETDFWKLRPYLPKETRNYVPLYIAATVMGLDPTSYGFEHPATQPLEFDEVNINDCVDLSVIAKCAGTDVNTIKQLNPSILRWCTPPGTSEYTLRIPKGNGASFDEKYAAVPDDQKRNEMYHKVHRHETLAAIAKKYGIPASLLAEANRLPVRKRLAVGSILLIPVPSSIKGSSQDFADGSESKRSSRTKHVVEKVEGRAGKDKIVYRIKKGDTLAEIARSHGVRLSDLRVWNDIPYGKKIKSGTTLTIWAPAALAGKKKSGAATSSAEMADNGGASDPSAPAANTPASVKVKSGDNLKKIATRYGVSIADLREWNNLQSDVIRSGQKLRLAGNVTDGSTRRRGSAQVSAKADSAKIAQNTTYRVRRGDTLTAIASLFRVSVDDLRQWNKIRGSRLKVGQQIRINS